MSDPILISADRPRKRRDTRKHHRKLTRECVCGFRGDEADASKTEAWCGYCGETVPMPVEDWCPVCGEEDCMGLACPECGGDFFDFR